MANSTGEGKGLSAEQVRDALVPLLSMKALTTVVPWEKITDKLNVQIRLNRIAANVERAIHESYASERDSALRLKLEQFIAYWREIERELVLPAKGIPEFIRLREAGRIGSLVHELSTLLTEESSQVGTKEGE